MVSQATAELLLSSRGELAERGVSVEPYEELRKSFGGAIELAAAVVTLAESGAARRFVEWLRERGVPREEILRLRLDEPENIPEDDPPPPAGVSARS